MFLRCLSLGVASLFVLGAKPVAVRVCAEPNNLPFSNEKGEGFENHLATLLSRDLGIEFRTVWRSERKDLVDHTLKEGRCDLLLGVPAGIPEALTTEPYYRSTYVFVTRASSNLKIASLYDDALAGLRIGMHIAGNDYAPPAAALARRGLVSNIKGYSLFGAYGEANPALAIFEALAAGKIDVAIAWGPLAGYFAARSGQPLTLTPISPPMDMGVPFTYAMTMAVREGDIALRDLLDQALAREHGEIKALLDKYEIPQLPLGAK